MNKLKLSVILMAATALVDTRAAELPVSVSANATNSFTISGMHCDGCAKGLTAEFKLTPGVASVEVVLSNQLAVVAYDTNRVSQAALINVAKEAGFAAKPVQP